MRGANDVRRPDLMTAVVGQRVGFVKERRGAAEIPREMAVEARSALEEHRVG
ncbi:MAG: hypothetical protein QF890_16590 [Myxococcota bacterium]|jgi:hypothetical protein|nr:hypothetical protein [bacterium]MDP6242263.1 hypothetical protein [Myxococcota bacterium]MDP7074424.1 hypothetical protein [Myxococcota bacterium]MDP7300576.1 hypothetical protein [Myxococcota bacterium]MDP7434177.1 hypothetical protein [Myxococcota bacterium]|tara:strand:+ start:146 stop:301 length:156 start_codon:yes stop_codon:yes gene_type:complete